MLTMHVHSPSRIVWTVIAKPPNEVLLVEEFINGCTGTSIHWHQVPQYLSFSLATLASRPVSRLHQISTQDLAVRSIRISSFNSIFSRSHASGSLSSFVSNYIILLAAGARRFLSLEFGLDEDEVDQCDTCHC